MNGNIEHLNKDERIKKIQESIEKIHTLILPTLPIDMKSNINWQRLNPIIYKLSEYITGITEYPTFIKSEVVKVGYKDVLETKSLCVETYDISNDFNLDSFLKKSLGKDIIFYSLMEMQGILPKRVIVRVALYDNYLKRIQEYRNEIIEKIIKDDNYFDEYH